MTEDRPPIERVYRVLLVDDEELLCRAVVRLMSTERSFAFRTVTSARQAPKVFAAEGPFDILLTDLHFPDGEGVALAGTLQRLNPGLKVIFMSGDIPDGVTGHDLALGKPFERDDLVQILKKALGPSR
jgi:DNA-binding NtrC family response regulator